MEGICEIWRSESEPFIVEDVVKRGLVLAEGE
jgi:hypothetical protein